MAWVYILKGANGRHYIGSTENLGQRLTAHNRGQTATTKRLGYPLELMASKSFESATEARKIERQLKAWKSPQKALAYLSA